MSSETPPPYGEPTPQPYGAAAPQPYGTPAPQQYGPPMPQPYGAPTPQLAAPQNGMGTAGLVMGILQFVLLGPLGSVLAIIFGRIGMNRAKRGEATNGGVATAAFWLGIIGLILTVVAAVIIVATGAFVVKETVKAFDEATDPALNSKTGLADGDYRLTPTDATPSINNDNCGFEGSAVDVATGDASANPVKVVGQGTTQCSTAVSRVTSVLFTVTDGVAKITQVESANP